MSEAAVQMTVDPATGGMKESKQVQFSLIPAEFLWQLAEHYGGNTPEFGGKYARENWLKGYRWSLSEDALMRHFYLWKGGQRYDAETGRHHLICCAWHIVALFTYDLRGLGTDDITRLESSCPK